MSKKTREPAAGGNIERWGLFELSLKGPSSGNPFIDVELTATFEKDGKKFTPEGFYDGNGVYKVRFSPDSEGEWHYKTSSNKRQLNGVKGVFNCVPPKKGNHGPVQVMGAVQKVQSDDPDSSTVVNPFHFRYADGSPYFQVGTTCYAWTHQAEKLQKQTLRTLKSAPFNKLRMCVFPKRYSWNENEPPLYPFEGKPLTEWDFTRFNPAFFQAFEGRIGDLMNLGVEADIILFHPYDKGHWGFDRMGKAHDDRYLRYCIARFAAYRNVWWSLANEYDFLKMKKTADWDRFGRIIHRHDPYGRLCSIHNAHKMFDFNRPWITHLSVQNGAAVADFGRPVLYRDFFNKPVVYDEVRYEGNIHMRWGDLSGEEMVMRFWHGTIGGTYVGHGETYVHPRDILWWSKGGVLHGESPARLAFLRKIIEESPCGYVEPLDRWFSPEIAGIKHDYYLVYFGQEKAKEWKFSIPRGGTDMPEGAKFQVELIDTWRMTVNPIKGIFEPRKADRYHYVAKKSGTIKLPGRQWLALRITRILP
jgi:hypothetical protein